MVHLATVIPLRPAFGPVQLTAEVIAWLRGMTNSRVIDEVTDADIDSEAPFLRSSAGEELRFLRLGDPAGADWAAGFRHDIPDGQGRIWRSEGVIAAGRTGAGPLFRLRCESRAADSQVRLEVPRRPHLLRALIEGGRVADDGQFAVRLDPHRLQPTDDDLLRAAAALRGEGTTRLPVVWVSCGDSGPALADDQVSRLALGLAGVAHVLVEPSRDFSFRLRELCDGANRYGGTVGLALPGRGLVARRFVGRSIPDGPALAEDIQALAIRLRSEAPAPDCPDWLDLQERAIRAQRQRERDRLSQAETEALWAREVATKDERIAELEAEIAALRAARPGGPASEASPDLPPVPGLGPELWPGEFRDRLRAALNQGADGGWDRRSLALFARALPALRAGRGLAQFREDLRRATDDASDLPAKLPRFLSRHGFSEKSANRHLRLEAGPDFPGVDTVTVPKTPGDRRSGMNLRAQIERMLGLQRLADD